MLYIDFTITTAGSPANICLRDHQRELRACIFINIRKKTHLSIPRHQVSIGLSIPTRVTSPHPLKTHPTYTHTHCRQQGDKVYSHNVEGVRQWGLQLGLQNRGKPQNKEAGGSSESGQMGQCFGMSVSHMNTNLSAFLLIRFICFPPSPPTAEEESSPSP